MHQFIHSGSTGAVVKAACLESRNLRARTPLWPSSFKETKCFFPVHSHYSILWGDSWPSLAQVAKNPIDFISFLPMHTNVWVQRNPFKCQLVFLLYLELTLLTQFSAPYVEILFYSSMVDIFKIYCASTTQQANKIHWPNVELMLAHRL